MSWSSITNNQTVSFNNLQDAVNTGVFTLKNTIPVPSTEQVTSGEADYYVNIIPTDKPATQLVVKSNLVPLTTTTTTTIACYSYEICADDGTGDRESYPYTYISCSGDPQARTLPNERCIDICAERNSVDSTSGFISITELGPCTTTTTTTAYVLVGFNTPFTTLAVSRGTGQYQLAGSSNFSSNPWQQGFVFRSNDYGVNWFRTSLYGFWSKVATSDDGQYMLAVEYYGKAYRSSNYGESWTQITNFPYPSIYNPDGFPALQTLSFRGAALSSNGQYQVICTAEDFYGSVQVGSSTIDFYYNTIFVSNDYGVTWSANRREENQDGVYNAVAISASGQTVVAARGRSVIGVGAVERSTNYGANWGQASPDVPGNLVDIAILADGSQAIAARFSNDYFPYLLASTDGGATWSNVTGGGLGAQQQWQRVSISINGAADAFALPNTVSQAKRVFHVPFLSTTLVFTPVGSDRWKAVATEDNGLYVLLGTTSGLFRSSDRGVNFFPVP